MDGSPLVTDSQIKLTAMSIGASKLDSAAIEKIGVHVEFHVKKILQEAIKFQEHGKRSFLTVEDINNALRLTAEEDEEIVIRDLVQSKLPPIPHDVTLTAHWLAVEGVQPAIPQNPSSNGFVLNTETASETTLSKEQQLFFEMVKEAMRSSEPEFVKAVVNTLRKDTTLPPLLPYFIKFISDEVKDNLSIISRLSNIMQMVDALCDSEDKNLHIEPYVHQVIPPVLTCVIGSLGESLDELNTLRKDASRILAKICRKFCGVFSSLQPRVFSCLVRCLFNPLASLSSHYGAIVAITEFGAPAIRELIVNNIERYMDQLAVRLTDTNEKARREAELCKSALLNASGVYVKNAYLQNNPTVPIGTTNIPYETLAKSIEKYDVLYKYFGDEIVSYASA